MRRSVNHPLLLTAYCTNTVLPAMKKLRFKRGSMTMASLNAVSALQQSRLYFLAYSRHLAPDPTIEGTAPCLRGAPAPLFEEKGDVSSYALVPDFPHPCRVNQPVARPALSPDDNPVDPLKGELPSRAKQGFYGKEPDGRRNLLQVGNSPSVPSIF